MRRVWRGASDAARLAVLVLASRTPSENGVVKIHTSELGRWLGMSASYTASAVVSELRRSGVVSVETEKASTARTSAWSARCCLCGRRRALSATG
ncbi:hypothetical protein Shyd_42000 [Streptomyces hydrogenans]|uniref:Uncharacterized protein n=1 Tax=Streptomyces hydrogenans TaxID=1873719 RepID=A0ABQ3PCW3_9ACTN|nr:hypothetical protein Shyd_42000 [Streptomyces hydrogenans]